MNQNTKPCYRNNETCVRLIGLFVSALFCKIKSLNAIESISICKLLMLYIPKWVDFHVEFIKKDRAFDQMSITFSSMISSYWNHSKTSMLGILEPGSCFIRAYAQH